MLDSCPICKKGKIREIEIKKLFLKSRKLVCNGCNAEFKIRDNNFELNLSNSSKESRFNGCVLSEEDWTSVLKHDKTIREVMLEEIKNGNLPVLDANNVNLPIILKKDEKVHLYENSNFYEPRAIRNYGGMSFRVFKGVRVYTGQGESHDEQRLIDNGTIILTNRRLIFSGRNRTVNTDLKKIINLTQYSDGFQINKENKQKPELYSTSRADMWCACVETAIKKSV